jgi:hypothetical protein
MSTLSKDNIEVIWFNNGQFSTYVAIDKNAEAGETWIGFLYNGHPSFPDPSEVDYTQDYRIIVKQAKEGDIFSDGNPDKLIRIATPVH